MNKILSATLFLSFLLTFHAFGDAALRVRVDTAGRTVFYNISSSVVESARVTPATYSPRSVTYSDLVQNTCSRYGVDAGLVKAIIQVESAYNPNAVSSAGAHGLMQLMPATAVRFGVRDRLDPAQNIEGGVKYLKFLTRLFPNDVSLAVASYNAGEHAVQRAHAVPNYTETQNYVHKVLALYKGDASAGYTRPRVRPNYYKYIDEKGIVHYSTSPSPNATKLQ